MPRIDRSASAAHEQFLWDTGFHWGEWCEPDSRADHFENLAGDFGILATAFFASPPNAREDRQGARPRRDADRYEALAGT